MKRIYIILLLLIASAVDSMAVQHKEARVVRAYPHDTTSYTQGLFFYGGSLFESTGQNGKSSFRIVDLESGKYLRRLDFSKRYFNEGAVIFDGRLYILTWQNKVVFVYDPENLKYVTTYSYPREGWGLTTDGKSLIASDGSSFLYFMDAELKTVKKLPVTINGRPCRMLNELEYIDGKIWANVYLTDMIVVIDPQSGEIETVVDCSKIFPVKSRSINCDVLNGIAVDEKGKLFLTGKNWPFLYEITLVDRDY